MVPFGDLSGYMNDLTSKKIPLMACASRKKLATSSLGDLGNSLFIVDFVAISVSVLTIWNRI